MIRLSLTCSLLLLFFTCDRTPRPPAATPTLTGAVRYLETGRRLEATLLLSPDHGKAPELFNSPLRALPAAGAGNYKYRTQQVNFPTRFQLTAPCGEKGASACQIDFTFTPPYADSLPTTIVNSETLRFRCAPTGLTDNEYLELFFEPVDRTKPRRILIKGPTSSGRVTVPRKAMQDIPSGDYQLYLVKTQLSRDSTQALYHSVQTVYFTRSVAVEVR